ncbi:class I SAM-dependent methyltransferase [Streptomyces sp. NPDC049099]|uniref:class I SAM-dependent methyltransferase n=1 Tax=Streptomyces sp. NPDC049099 TaxID=3155768 RepID=UPI00341F670B
MNATDTDPGGLHADGVGTLLSASDARAMAHLAGALVNRGSTRRGRLVVERGPAQPLCLAFDIRSDDVAVRRADPGEPVPSDTLCIRLDAPVARSIAAGETLMEDALSTGRLELTHLLPEDHRLSALVEELLTRTVVPLLDADEPDAPHPLVGWGRRAGEDTGVDRDSATRVLEWAVGRALVPELPEAEAGHHITRFTMYEGIRQFFTTGDRTGRVLEVSGSGGAIVQMFPAERTEVVSTGYPEVDATALPFPDAEFDHVVCDQVVEHLPDPRRAVQECRRVLRPGGWLLLATCFMDPVHTRPDCVDDYWRFTPQGLRELVKDFSRVYQCEGWGNREALAVVLFGGLMKYVPVRGNPFLERVASYNDPTLPLSVWVIAQA